MPFQVIFRLPVVFAALIALVSVSALAFWLSKPSIEPIGWEEREQSWQQSTPFFKPYNASSSKTVMNRELWGLAEVQQEENQQVEWAIKGIVNENGTRSFIADLTPENKAGAQKKFARFTLEDTLPDGGTVVVINKDSVVYEIDGKKLEKHLYELSNSKGEKGL